MFDGRGSLPGGGGCRRFFRFLLFRLFLILTRLLLLFLHRGSLRGFLLLAVAARLADGVLLLLERLLACEIYVYGIDSDLHVRDGRRHATGTADKIIDAIKSSTSRTSLWEAFALRGLMAA